MDGRTVYIQSAVRRLYEMIQWYWTGHGLERVGQYLAKHTVEDECYSFKFDLMWSISMNYLWNNLAKENLT